MITSITLKSIQSRFCQFILISMKIWWFKICESQFHKSNPLYNALNIFTIAFNFLSHFNLTVLGSSAHTLQIQDVMKRYILFIYNGFKLFFFTYAVDISSKTNTWPISNTSKTTIISLKLTFLVLIYQYQLKGTALPGAKNIGEKYFEFLAYNTPQPPLSVHKKISAQSVQPFGRLYATVIYIYKCPVFYIDIDIVLTI